jgi:cellulase/cellobiase CelA1
MIGFDAKNFVDYAMTLDCPTGNKCVLPNWYLLSIQAGFEPWVGGVGLKSTTFSADATTSTGPTVVSDRHTDDGRPIRHWEVPFNVLAQGCPNSSPTLVIREKGNDTNPDPTHPQSVTITDFTEDPAGSGKYVFHVGALYPMHGDVIYTVSFPGGCSTPEQSTEGYIDPSGRVRTPAGDPVAGATVTLYRSDNPSGPFTVVPAGSTLMSEANRSNSDTTGQDGSFGWDVQAGYYKVRAEKAGCVSPTNPSQPYVETAVMNIPPEVTDIDLRLKCNNNSGLPVVVTKSTDWGTGYCANVRVTNNTTSPVNWNVSFSLAPFGGGTIYTFWNAVYTQNGSNITNVHANPAYPWNRKHTRCWLLRQPLKRHRQ